MPDKKKHSHKKKIIIIAILIIIILIIFTMCENIKKNMQKNNSITKTEKIVKRDLVSSISASGTFINTNKLDISASLTNVEVKKINVEVGDTVSKGDILCVFDTKDIKDNLKDSNNSLSITSKQANLSEASAKDQLDSALAARKENKNSLKKNTNDAKKALSNAINSVKYAENALSKAKSKLNKLKASDPTYSQIKVNVQNAETSLSTAKQQKASAKKEYDSIVSSGKTSTRTCNEAVKTARQNLENTSLSSQQSINTANQQKKLYEKELKKGTLVATTDGIISSINVTTGSIYNGTTAFSIQEEGSLKIETEISQYDIADIKKGMKVLIKTDSTKDAQLEGIVEKVAVIATSNASNLSSDAGTVSSASSSSVSDATYTVTIKLNKQNQRLRLGMTANLSIITQQVNNVLTVPYNSIHSKDDISYINIMTSDKKNKKITVTTGLESAYYIEVKGSDLKEGMNVIIPSDGSSSLDSLFSGNRNGMNGIE